MLRELGPPLLDLVVTKGLSRMEVTMASWPVAMAVQRLSIVVKC